MKQIIEEAQAANTIKNFISSKMERYFGIKVTILLPFVLSLMIWFTPAKEFLKNYPAPNFVNDIARLLIAMLNAVLDRWFIISFVFCILIILFSFLMYRNVESKREVRSPGTLLQTGWNYLLYFIGYGTQLLGMALIWINPNSINRLWGEIDGFDLIEGKFFTSTVDVKRFLLLMAISMLLFTIKELYNFALRKYEPFYFSITRDDFVSNIDNGVWAILGLKTYQGDVYNLVKTDNEKNSIYIIVNLTSLKNKKYSESVESCYNTEEAATVGFENLENRLYTLKELNTAIQASNTVSAAHNVLDTVRENSKKASSRESMANFDEELRHPRH